MLGELGEAVSGAVQKPTLLELEVAELVTGRSNTYSLNSCGPYSNADATIS